MGLSLLRDFLLSVPLVLLLPAALGVTGALYSAPIADTVSFIAVLVIIRYIRRYLDCYTDRKKEAPLPRRSVRKQSNVSGSAT